MNKKRQPMNFNTEMTEMLELSDKAFEASMIQKKMVERTITNTLETDEKTKNLSKQTEGVKKAEWKFQN